MARSKADEVLQSCIGTNCLQSAEPLKDDALRLANISTAMFVSGGVLAAVGVTLLITRPGGSKQVGLRIMPTSLSLHARF